MAALHGLRAIPAALLAVALMAQAQSARGEDALARLRGLVEAAPSRQVGQPGNEYVNEMVSRKFAEAVARHNPEAAWAKARELVAESDAAEARLFEARQRAQIIGSSAEVITSSFLARNLFEDPWPLTAVFLLFGAGLALGWKTLKRHEMGVVGITLLAVAALLPILAIAVTTEAERETARLGDDAVTVQVLQDAIEQAARDALTADEAAANALKGLWQGGTITFPSVSFKPGNATLTTASGAECPLYQMSPNLVEPGNIPGGRFEGKLVYVGSGSPMELEGKALEGSIAVLDFHSNDNWLSAVQLGAKLIIVIEPEETRPMVLSEAIQKTSASPISTPRFYMKRADFDRALGSTWVERGEPTAAFISQPKPGRWDRVKLESHWLFIPGQGEPDFSLPFHEDRNRQIVHLQACMDSSSLVPEFSPGAAGASNLVVLLDLLDKFERTPPKRPVLLSVVNDHANALRGAQEFAFAAFASPAGIREELTYVDRELAQTKLVQDVFSQEPTAALLEGLRDRIEMVGGRVFTVKEPIVDKLTAARNLARDKRTSLQFQLERLIAEDDPDIALREQLEAEIAALDARVTEVVTLSGLFNRLGIKTYYRNLSDLQKEQLGSLFAEVTADARLSYEELATARQALISNLSIRKRLLSYQGPSPSPAGADASFDWRNAPPPIVLAVKLDLSYGADKVGFFFRGGLTFQPEFESEGMHRSTNMARHSLAVAAELERDKGIRSLLEDTIRKAKGITWQGHLGGLFPFSADASQQYRIPGLTLATVRDSRPFSYTPHDTVDRIDRGNFLSIVRFVGEYIPRLIDSARLGYAYRLSGRDLSLAYEVIVRKQDKFSATVPKTILPGALIMANPRGGLSKVIGDVRPWMILITDGRGAANFRGYSWNMASMQVFQYDEDFQKIIVATDYGEGERRFTSTMSLPRGMRYDNRNLVSFDASKVDLIGLTQPLTFRTVDKVEVIDAFQDSTPRSYSITGLPSVTTIGINKAVPLSRDGTASIFLPPDSVFKLRAGLGLAINSTVKNPQGEGFPASIGMIGNIAFTSAKDMLNLTASRLEILSERGVTDERTRMLNDMALEMLASAEGDEALSERLEKAEEARGIAYHTYDRTLSTTNDLIRAVVILLGLVVPFCFFFMKLVTPFTDMNRQLLMFMGIFLAMALALQFVHPAFRIASTPHVVVLAFVMLGLSVFVSSTLVGRFNSSMSQAVEEIQKSATSDAPQGRLAGMAFIVGVNNMKRRRIRTTLTAVTIVLVTFTMLSVISVGRDMEPVQLRLGAETPYTGYVFVEPGLTTIESGKINRMKAHAAEDAASVARLVIERKGAFGEYLAFELRPMEPEREAQSDSFAASVILGLELREDGFLRPMPLIAGSWFSADTAAEVILSRDSAAILGITPENYRGKAFWLEGRRVELVGLLDDEDLEAMRDIADLPFLPMLTSASEAAQRQEASDSASQITSLSEIPGTRPARGTEVLIMPARFASTIGASSYKSLSVRYTDGDDGEAVARRAYDDVSRLMRFQDLRLFLSLRHGIVDPDRDLRVDPGHYAMVSSSSAEVGGKVKVAIPILLAATIIFNTMLGAVMERKREISIYNVIGLNPTHVMMFFLAESLVFGIIGSVAGYLIGQALSLGIGQYLGLNLNYSSLSVMLVIFLAILTVLLSTIYPAMLAARAAVPSGKRRWSLPQPDGDQIHVDFPFSYDSERARGVCAYLLEFMRLNSEASTASFLSREIAVGLVPSPRHGSEVFAMVFDVAPAPFDLGVNQKMEVYAYYDDHVKAHRLSVHLERTSGEKSNWVSANQPFLESLRKRLLGWRSQSDKLQKEYCDMGRSLFEKAGKLPVVESKVKQVSAGATEKTLEER